MDSLGCFGIRNSDKFILHFNQVCFQIYGMAPPYRRQRADAPFTAEQEAWLILEYGAVKNISVLKRHFQQHFVITTRKVPSYMAFKRLVERFIATSFAESLDQEEVVKSARHLRQRAKACKHVGGATFEGSLKRILKDLDAVEE